MTEMNITPTDQMMLQACKHYMRITQVNEQDLINELMDLAGQYCHQLPEELKDEYVNQKG